MAEINDYLTELGFNRLESEVYVYLLTHEPATAYKIGKQITKPTANVYKAIESLSKKGAVIIEDNKSKICKAVSPDEFFNHYEKSMLDKTEKAKIALIGLHKNSDDERSYSIESVDLVFEKFIAMMQKCQSIAVIDAFPKTLKKVSKIIEQAAQRGIDVHIEAYEPIEINGTNITCVEIGKKALDHWKSQQLNLIIDGDEHLIALLDDNIENVIQALWSNNNYMSCMLHAGFLREQTIFKITDQLNKPNFEEKVKEILDQQKFFFNSNIPGFNKLFNRKK
ncbi:MAG: hypothetical protein JEZ09_11815 [Salinivirgaceae bacterium]|nr:hypothetical protein [Salinivirgaceae bacterium]